MFFPSANIKILMAPEKQILKLWVFFFFKKGDSKDEFHVIMSENVICDLTVAISNRRCSGSCAQLESGPAGQTDRRCCRHFFHSLDGCDVLWGGH